MFVIHGIPGSPYVRSPLLALEEKGVPYTLAAFAFGGQRSPEHTARHPFQKMPALEHDGFALYEAQAILRYIDRVAGGPSLTPSDIRQTARMDQLLNIADHYLAPRITGPMAFQRLVAPRFGMPVDEARIEAAIPDGAVAVGEVARLLDDQPFMAGDAISLADCHLISQLSFLPHFDEGRALLAPHANLSAWIARMEARPSMAATSWERLMEKQGQALPPLPEVMLVQV
ncbi:glutathione S-transferase family protein [Sphingomonas sp. LB-2]|uniref:glutathione S-transferase family protein n=1 Tax=Sphingomonas caeni TaxID=2984949 RepID=UPI0022317195|nr:glutathione S-transferase family protein [Sphingomonas caeni]MCW3847260.1 glutathione S-transferase family protein [Sphingomonas caeni]